MYIKKILCLLSLSIALLISLSDPFSEIGTVFIIGFNVLIGLMCIPKINKLLRKLGYVIGHTVSHISLAVIYYFYIFPIAIFFKFKKSVQTIATDTYKTQPKSGRISFDDMH